MPQAVAEQIRSIPMSTELGQSLERAHGFAREQSHRTVTLEHLLLAFTEDPDASAVLQASNIDLLRLGTDVSGYLGRLPDDMRSNGSAEPQPDAELVRVLQAAVQAAQQSRRRHIDGAIVLAAIVGDGKSPAAGLLKAHGLTFEEAIRALQKATAKPAAQPRPKAPEPSQAPAPAPSDPESVTGPMKAASAPSAAMPATRPHDDALRRREADAGPAHGAAASVAPGGGANGAASAPVAQTVDEILAAARARIQQRSGAAAAPAAVTSPKAETPRPAPVPLPEPQQAVQSASPAPAPVPVSPPPGQSQAAIPERPAPPAVARPAPPQAAAVPQAKADGPAASPGWAPPPGPVQVPPVSPLPAGRPPAQGLATGPKAAPPFPQVPTRPGEGASRLPLPDRHDPNLPPQRPAPAPPWPVPGPGAMAPNTGPGSEPGTPPQPRPRQRGAPQPGQGPLVETIPRRMRAATPVTAQVRISRDRVDGLILLLMKGRGVVQRPEAFLSRALTVRLKAPDGGFWIEALSPETQWGDPGGPPGRQSDDHLTWRWTVIPRDRGRSKLHLVVTARTIGHDGAVVEASPPDRVIEVAVSGARFSGFGHWARMLVTLLIGAVIGRFGGEAWDVIASILRRVSG